jgi:hypothetical protein
MENDITNALLKSGEITKKGSTSLSIIRYADDFVVIYPKLEQGGKMPSINPGMAQQDWARTKG